MSIFILSVVSESEDLRLGGLELLQKKSEDEKEN